MAHIEYRVNKRGDFTCRYSERVFTDKADAEAWLEECKDKERELPISDADELYIESRKVESWGDVNGENPTAFDLLLKLAAYLERSHDEWYVKFPNVGDSDMACQRMHNFVTDMHKILDQFGIRDRVKELKAEKKRYQDYFFEFHGNKRQEKKCMEQLEWVNKWLAEELAKREAKK